MARVAIAYVKLTGNHHSWCISAALCFRFDRQQRSPRDRSAHRPVRPSDARLRRAQALAPESGAALRIVRELIGQKLTGQERIAREKLCNSSVAETIAKVRSAVAKADSIQTIHLPETQGAGAYWSAWHTLPVMFPKLACDLMEPVRPQVDAYVLDWITRECLRREWFFEQRDGNCRLMGSFAVRLAETAPIWARAIAPIAEGVVRALWATRPKPARQHFPATRLTQGHRREAKDSQPNSSVPPVPRPPAVCRVCGVSIEAGRSYCASCAVGVSRDGLIEVAKLGRVAGHSAEARARQAEKQQQHAAEAKTWNSSDKPDWLTEEVYQEKIQPRLSGITVPAISAGLGLSEPYAAEIRAGRQRPHPRHWLTLAQLVDVSQEE